MPFREHFERGQPIGGSLRSWAVDDGDARIVRRFIVLNDGGPSYRIVLDFRTALMELKSLTFVTKAKTLDPGVFRIYLELRNWATNQHELISGPVALGLTYATFAGQGSGNLASYIKDGVIQGRISVLKPGPSTAFHPRLSFEYANAVVD